jgi:hypothetical protein
MNVPFIFPDAPAFALAVKSQVLENLSKLRQEWEVAAGEDGLLDVTASVGLMLLDIATKLGLTPEERSAFLGAHLNQDVASAIDGENVQ